MGFQNQVNFGCYFSMVLSPNLVVVDTNTLVFTVQVTYSNSKKRAANDKPTSLTLQGTFTQTLTPPATTGSLPSSSTTAATHTSPSTSSSGVSTTGGSGIQQQASSPTQKPALPVAAIAGSLGTVFGVGIAVVVAIVIIRKRRASHHTSA